METGSPLAASAATLVRRYTRLTVSRMPSRMAADASAIVIAI
jgi:hypothetical protein